MSHARVVRLVTRLNIGGPAIQAILLSRDLADEFPTLLAVGRPSVGEGELSDPDIPIYRVPLARSIRPDRDIRAFLAVRALLKKSTPELVHTHMAKAGTIGRLAASTVRPRPRLVHTFHGHVLDEYFRPAVQRAFVEIERRLARRTDAIVAVSEEIRDSLLALGIGRPERFHVIPLGFDLAAFLSVREPSGSLRRELAIDPRAPVVGVLGRLAPIKDHLTLFKAIARVPDAHLVVLGDGELRRSLATAARDLRISERTHFCGWRSDVAAAMADIDVVALTSKNEGTPVSIIEASASARPVVVTDVGGVRAVVDDGETGYLVRPGDPDAVSAALRRLLEDPALRKEFGNNGRRRVQDRFGKERLIADMRDLYTELLSRGKPHALASDGVPDVATQR